MAKIPSFDPMTSNAKSPIIAGLTEACNKLSSVLDMKTSTFEDLQMQEVFISEEDRFRIYQVPLTNKLWLMTPPPVIKKNGIAIVQGTDHFSIDFIGGSVEFEEKYVLTASDMLTASATYIVDESNKIKELVDKISTLTSDVGKNKGAYQTLTDLTTANPNGTAGDYAIVSGEDAIYIWSVTQSGWVNSDKPVDLSAYYTKTQTDALLNEKENFISPQGVLQESDNYYFGGRKTWIDIMSKIRSCQLVGLSVGDSSLVTAADSVLTAIGKLQAQISNFKPYITGSSAPTTATEGEVGQDYINSANGDKYHLVEISTDESQNTIYIWEKYGPGNMLKSVYDPTGKATDLYEYVDSKSAYQEAVDSGYTGTAEEFYGNLSAGPWIEGTGSVSSTVVTAKLGLTIDTTQTKDSATDYLWLNVNGRLVGSDVTKADVAEVKEIADDAIAKIGDIGTILDSINGEVI